MPLYQHRLELEESDNPLYYGLFKGFNQFIERYNLLQKRIQAINPKVWRYRKCKKELNVIRPDLSAFVLDYLKWHHDVSNFILKPTIVVSNADDPSVPFLHYMDNLRDAANHLENNVTIVEANFNFIGNLLDSTLNFGIAMGSFALTFLGLVTTLYALLK